MTARAMRGDATAASEIHNLGLAGSTPPPAPIHGDAATSAAWRATVRAIALHWRAVDLPPTSYELAALLGLASPSSLLVRLRKMRDAGLVTFADGKARTLRLTQAGIELAEQREHGEGE